MTRIWEEVVEEGIVTEKSSRATELIIVLIILAIIAFAVGCLFNLASPSSEARVSGVDSGLRETACEDALFNQGAGIHKRRPALTFDGPKRQTTETVQVPPAYKAGRTMTQVGKQQSRPTVIITAYCPKSCCCGEFADGITASGHIIEPNDYFVAAPPWIPFGTRLSIPGYAGGRMVSVEDRGGKIKGNKIDVFFDTHEKALVWGVKYLRIGK